MIVPKTLHEINQLIADGVEENISLDYKAADALQNTDGKKKEIAKDVSAMANSAGGVIIYGVSEFQDEARKHLPERITPVDRATFSKEQLEQIISSNISPKVDGLLIYPVSGENPNDVIYVVEIPQGSTAHQNTRDQRYYKRFNFESVPMLDYEIRDVMNRLTNPRVELTVIILLENDRNFSLVVSPYNSGHVYAKYVKYFVDIPKNLVNPGSSDASEVAESDSIRIEGENIHQDVLGLRKSMLGYSPEYGPSRFSPLLPGLHGKHKKISLSANPILDDRKITWTLHADNAAPQSGSIRLNEIEIVEKPQG